MVKNMKIKFWGTRGSIPVPEPEMMKYGGNTACIEIRLDSGLLIIFDAGTGIRKLGLELIKDKNIKKEGHIFISHCHWDHIQGFPFFAPAFDPSFTWNIYGQLKVDGRLEKLLKGQMEHLYFPVSLDNMGATIKFIEIIEEEFYIEDVKIVSRHLNHPQGNMGFRLEYKGNIFVYCTDTEHYENRFDERVLELAHNADILVYDSQYTEEEYKSHKGWGHSTWKAGVDIANKCNVKKLVLFHHDPIHDDKFIDKIVEKARKIFPNTLGAQREMVINLPNNRISPDILKYINLKNKELIITLPKNLEFFNSQTFIKTVNKLLKKDIKICIFNFCNLEKINSDTLKTLASFYEKCKNLNKELKIINVTSQNIYESLRIARFTQLIKIEDKKDNGK